MFAERIQAESLATLPRSKFWSLCAVKLGVVPEKQVGNLRTVFVERDDESLPLLDPLEMQVTDLHNELMLLKLQH